MRTAPFLVATLALGMALGTCSCAKAQQPNEQNTSTRTMDLSKITDPVVRAAMEAWQAGDKKTFLSHFTTGAKMTDDGNPRDFAKFVQEACGTEKFLELDTVKDGGRELIGKFDAGHWGVFRVYFRFHPNGAGKFGQLDIGQAH